MAKNTRDIVRFEGHLDREEVDHILVELQEKLNQEEVELVTRKRIYSASVECLDNIFKHADVETIPEELYRQHPSRFRLVEMDKDYRLEVSNVVLHSEVKAIRKKLERLNNLQKGELNELYKDTIRQGSGLSDKGGAGLGLIVLAKTTNEPIYYRFTSIGKEHAYFTLIIHIS